MGKRYYKRVIIVAICLVAVGIFSNSLMVNKIDDANNATRLGTALEQFDGWKKRTDFKLDDKVVAALSLDDFLFREYAKDGDHIVLYIGYYHTFQKVGAAHDPLVCFPGQGWVLSEKSEQTMALEIKKGETRQINYNTMIGELSGKKELIVYWFQSYDKTAHSTLWQKVQLLWGRIMNHNEDNAFVRISITLDRTRNREDAMIIAKKFMTHFYPSFINFINMRTT